MDGIIRYRWCCMFCWHADGKTVSILDTFCSPFNDLEIGWLSGCSHVFTYVLTVMSYEMRDVMGRPYLCCIWVCKQSRHHEPNADNSCFNLIFLMSMQRLTLGKSFYQLEAEIYVFFLDKTVLDRKIIMFNHFSGSIVNFQESIQWNPLQNVSTRDRLCYSHGPAMILAALFAQSWAAQCDPSSNLPSAVAPACDGLELKVCFQNICRTLWKYGLLPSLTL